MNVTLKNDVLTVAISSFGAELQSIKNNRTGHEYLWHGDSRFWGRRSPLLFPIVGSLWQGEYRMDGMIYKLGQHGFARDHEFEAMTDCNENEAWFSLISSDETLALYPRRFRLEVGYSLVGERLSVMWRVHNEDEREMWFQIGAHPAFNYPDFNPNDAVHGYAAMGKKNLHAQFIAEKGCVGISEEAVRLDSDGLLPLTADTFARDAIILAENQVRRVSLMDKNHSPYLTLLFEAPLVGLWSPKPEAPFMCIEPWWGRCDRVGYDKDFSKREYAQCVEPGNIFEAGYTVIIDNL